MLAALRAHEPPVKYEDIAKQLTAATGIVFSRDAVRARAVRMGLSTPMPQRRTRVDISTSPNNFERTFRERGRQGTCKYADALIRAGHMEGA